MGLDFLKFQGHLMVRFQVEIHRALARAGLAVTITVWKPLLTLQHVHRRTSLVECGYLHCNKPLVVKVKAAKTLPLGNAIARKKAPCVKSGLLHPPLLVFCYPLRANAVGRGFGERRGGDLMRGGDGASGPVA